MNEQSVNLVTMERIVPDQLSADETTGSETLKLHLERYEFARRNLVPGTLLDIACGVGYGTALLAQNSGVTNALGVDISDEAVRYAAERYGNQRTSFICSDGLAFSPGQQFENIVSLETIEHVDAPRRFFAHLVSLLAPGGRLIASVPVTPCVDANPHHKSNFTVRTFRRMGDAFSLKYMTSFRQDQPFNPISVATRKETRTVNLRQNLPAFYVAHPSHFFLRIWSVLRDGFVNKYMTIVWEK
jgi:2-polyprenyl-3-methyl-5-hydroxy-6-metoxy-1,4-benzoquinol methylase